MNRRTRSEEFLDAQPASSELLVGVLAGDLPDVGGDELVRLMDDMIAWSFERIRSDVAPHTLSADAARFYISELSVFARYNSQFLHRAADSVQGTVFELAHEFRRNHLEEGGERGMLPSHFVLYSSALLKDLGLLVNGRVPQAPTQTVVVLHDVLVNSHCASTICGAYYATEGVAIDETLLLRDITDRYASLVRGADAVLPNLKFYYDLHLDDSSDAAREGLGVEAGHQEGIARFIRQYDVFRLEPQRILDGFLQLFNAMTTWWDDLVRLCASGAI